MSEVILTDETGALSPDLGDTLVRAVNAVLEAEVGEAAGRCEVGLTIVEPDRIRALNREWRDEDRPTDVLSFPVDPVPTAATGEVVALGDIVICPDAIEAEGARARERELILLAVHGVLHLLGHDHDTEETESRMFALQGAYTEEVLGR